MRFLSHTFRHDTNFSNGVAAIDTGRGERGPTAHTFSRDGRVRRFHTQDGGKGESGERRVYKAWSKEKFSDFMSISAVGDDIITSLWPRVRGSRRWKTNSLVCRLAS